MIFSFQFLNTMIKFFIIFFLTFTGTFTSVFGMKVKIVAIVNEEVITSYDLENRIKLTQILNPEAKKATMAELEPSVLDRMIKEKLISKAAAQNSLVIDEKEVEKEVQNVIKSNPAFKGKNSKAILGNELYKSLKEQVLSEILFSIMVQSTAREKTNFTEDEITRFQNSYNENTENKIDKNQAKQMLASMKFNEVQQNLLKNLEETAVIEKK